MNEIVAISAIGEAGAIRPETVLPQASALPNALVDGAAVAGGDFASVIAQQLSKVDAKVAHADAMVTQFAIDDSVPIHQVTFALEEARLSVEIAGQVRQRFVEGYRELMNMQL